MSPSHIRPAPSVYLRVFITPWHWRALHISSSVDVHCWISTALKTLQYEDRLRQHKRWDVERSSCHQHKGVLELVALHLLSASSHMLRYIHSSSVLMFKGNYCEVVSTRPDSPQAHAGALHLSLHPPLGTVLAYMNSLLPGSATAPHSEVNRLPVCRTTAKFHYFRV